jgi:hypothetical protein
MQYFKVNDDTFIQFDPTNFTSKTVTISGLQNEIEASQNRLAQIPVGPSDADLLAWARQNYPMTDYSAEINMLNNTIANDQSILTVIQGM